MSSVSYAQAKLLSYCGAAEPYVDSWTTDQVRRFLKVQEMETQCRKTVRVSDADKPAIDFIASGGVANDLPVAWQAGPTQESTRTETWLEASGEVKDNLALVESAVDVQARLLAAVLEEGVYRNLWATAPLPNAFPTIASAASANPNGELDLQGLEGLQPMHLGCLRLRVSPVSPQSRLVYVMHSKTLAALEEGARNQAIPIPYLPERETGALYPHFGSFPILACDFISLQETAGPDTTSVYLVRVGSGPDDPVGTQPVSMLVPRGRKGVQVSAFTFKDGALDMWRKCISMDVTMDYGSATSVARAKRVLSP